MADSLIDLGGGVKMVNPQSLMGEVKPIDPIDSASKLYGLANLQSQMQVRASQEQRDQEMFPYSLNKQKGEAVTQQANGFKSVATLAAQGNSAAATFLLGQLVPQYKDRVAVMLSSDPNKANKGIVDLVNIEDGSILYSQDPFKDDRVTSDITLKRNLTEKYVDEKYKRGAKREDQLLTLAEKISTESQGTINIQDALKMSNDILDMSQTKDNKKLFGDQGLLSKDFIADHVANAELVKHTNRSGNFKFGLKPLDPSQEKEFATGLDGIQNIADNVIPLFQAINSENTLFKTGLLGSSINSLKNRFKQGDPEYTVLKNFSDKAKWDIVLKFAATTFTDKVVDQLKPLVPNDGDHLDVAMGKATAFMSMFNQELHNTLNAAEANGKRVDGFRELLNPGSKYNQIGSLNYSTSEGRQFVIADTILNQLPDSVKKNSKTMDLILNPLPINLKNAMKSQMIEKGYELPTKSTTDMAIDLFNLEK